MKSITTKKIALCGLFAALTAVCAQISIPIGPVPINMAHLSVFMAAGILGSKYGALSQVVYLCLGAMGLPVFSGFMGGLGRLTGPTGGYIVGYVVTAFVVGLLFEKFGRKKIWMLIIWMYIGWVAEYVIGTAWFCYITKTSVMGALSLCMFPFLPGDLVKTLVCAFEIPKLYPAVTRLIKE